MSLLTLLDDDVVAAPPPAPNLYETLFADLSVSSGFVLHGTLSSFFEDSAGTTDATTSGTSPVGRITDISGLENHLLQNTSGNKPVFYSGDGIKSFRSGTLAGGAERYLRPTTQPGLAAAFTVACVGYMNFASESPNNWGPYLTNYDGGWLSGIYVRLGMNPGGYHFVLASTGTSETNAADGGIGTAGTTPRIIVIRRSGTGSNQTTIKVYSLAGSLLASATGTQDGAANTDLLIGGYNGLQSDPLRIGFLLYANGVDVGADNEAAIVADLSSTFGSWTGGAP